MEVCLEAVLELDFCTKLYFEVRDPYGIPHWSCYSLHSLTI
jgi:hypothetical protein